MSIELKGISKRFGTVAAVENVSFSIAEGELVALIGPSGGGKTTVLRMIAGLEVPTEGEIFIRGEVVNDQSVQARNIGFVFQGYALFKTMSVFDNIAFGMSVRGRPKAEIAERVGELLKLLQIEGLDRRYPHQLSGGQRQRVALARALVKRPRVLLLDEPLSALDAKLREAMRSELAQLQDKVGITFIIVTHDQDEALAMASRCAVMNRGLLQQVATPSDLYEFPNSRFVADFIGQVNMFEGRLAVDEPDRAVVQTTELPAPVFLDHGVSGARDATVWVALRPEKIELHKRGDGRAPPAMSDAPVDHNVVPGVIKHLTYLGSESVYDVEIAGGRMVRALRTNLTRWDQEDFTWDEPVWLSWHACSPAVLLS